MYACTQIHTRINEKDRIFSCRHIYLNMWSIQIYHIQMNMKYVYSVYITDIINGITYIIK